MTRSPDIPAGRFRLPPGTVVYHGSRLEFAERVRIDGLRPRKPTGPYGNWRNPAEPKILRQPAGIYVVNGEAIEAVLWATAAVAAASDPRPCIWKIDASGLTATADPAYPENPKLLILVGRVGPERLLDLYDDCSREPWVSFSLATRPQSAP